MKIIAFYLPQFHEIEENNQLWGKGFTEWTNVKRAIPLFKDHFQPVEPLNDNYYDLTNIEVMRWQTKLAKEYGIYGFCFYHYWYNGHLLLQRPIENYLNHRDIDFPYCLCWANHDWTTSWTKDDIRTIYKQTYSDKQEWCDHFDYFLKFFRDERYIKNNGKPLLVIYDVAGISELNEMLEFWDTRARENGFAGIDFAYQSSRADILIGFDDSPFTYDIEYQPQYVRAFCYKNKSRIFHTILKYVREVNNRTIDLDLDNIFDRFKKKRMVIHNYDDLWGKILSMKPVSTKSIPGAFVNIDTSPRSGKNGVISVGGTPEKFEHYLRLQIERAERIYKTDMLFLFAWNEWAEGAYMEPDKRWEYGMLEAVRNALGTIK